MATHQLQLPIKNEELQDLFHRYGVVEASVFGSYARGDFTPSSDLDLLVELEPGRSYMDLGGLQYELQQKTGKKVDVVFKSSIRKSIRPVIDKEKIDLKV